MHVNMDMGYFTVDKLPIDQTSLPTHLDQMVVLLQEEENTCESDTTGPCMEYLLQHKLLETLYSLGRTDVSQSVVVDTAKKTRELFICTFYQILSTRTKVMYRYL